MNLALINKETGQILAVESYPNVKTIPKDGKFRHVIPSKLFGISSETLCSVYSFNTDTKQFVRAQTLAQAITAKCKQLNKQRDAKELEPFLYLGKYFDADAKSIKRITTTVQAAQAAVLAGNTFNIEWTCADNSTITLSETQILGILEAMLARGVELHETCKSLKASVKTATSKDDIDSIVWPNNYP